MAAPPGYAAGVTPGEKATINRRRTWAVPGQRIRRRPAPWAMRKAPSRKRAAGFRKKTMRIKALAHRAGSGIRPDALDRIDGPPTRPRPPHRSQAKSGL